VTEMCSLEKFETVSPNHMSIPLKSLEANRLLWGYLISSVSAVSNGRKSKSTSATNLHHQDTEDQQSSSTLLEILLYIGLHCTAHGKRFGTRWFL